MKSNRLKDLDSEIQNEYRDLMKQHGSLSRKLTNSKSKDYQTKMEHCSSCDGLRLLDHCPVYDHPYDCEWGDYVSSETLAAKNKLAMNESAIYDFCRWHVLRYPLAIVGATLIWYIFA